MEQNVAMNVIE